MIIEHKGVIKYNLQKIDEIVSSVVRYQVRFKILWQNEKLRSSGLNRMVTEAPFSTRSIDCPELDTRTIYLRGRRTSLDEDLRTFNFTGPGRRDTYYDNIVATLLALAKHPGNKDLYQINHKQIQLRLL